MTGDRKSKGRKSGNTRKGPGIGRVVIAPLGVEGGFEGRFRVRTIIPKAGYLC